jgi:pimeloyl-ACP methyl ester carboxylesterase
VSLLATLAVPGSALSAAAPAVPTAGQAEPHVPAQNATFAVFVRGFQMGTEQLTVDRAADELVVRGNGRLQPPVDLTLRSAEIRYGPDLAPHRVLIDGWLRGRNVGLSTRFEDTTAVNAFEAEGQQQETRVEVSPRAVVLPELFFGAYAVLGARLARASVGDEFRAYIAPQGEIPVVLNEVIDERIQVASRSFVVRRHRVTFRNPGAPYEADVETEEDGKLVRVTLPHLQIQVSREDVASVASRQQRFTRAGDEDVRIPANGFSLAATISRPNPLPPPARGQKAARLPAIVLVPDEGSVDRDQFVHGVPVLGQLASDLADAGFLVVRYDKRGLGQSGGREEAATLADFADDVVWTVRWLRERKDVDPANVTVVGHGQGAWVALLAASREKRITRVAVIAAAGVKGQELVLEQQERALQRTAIDAEEKQKRVDLQRRIHAAVLGEGAWDGIPEPLRRQADSVLFASMLAFDPVAVVARLRQPLLILAAERDRQVPAHHAEKLATAARARKKNPGVELVTIPGVNHLLVAAATGEPEEYPTLPERRISAAVGAEIASWIKGR